MVPGEAGNGGNLCRSGHGLSGAYGSNGFQVDSVSLDPPDDFRIQQLIQDDLRFTGFSDKRTERHERKWIDYRIRKQQVIGWIDAAFTTQTSLGPVTRLMRDLADECLVRWCSSTRRGTRRV
jgi:hypothetical protein